MTIRPAVGSLVLVLVGSLASAQTLAEVAQREEARRKTVKQPAKVYTNDDLPGGSTAAPPPPPAVHEAAPVPAGEEQDEPGQAKPAEPAKTQSVGPPAGNGAVKDETYWRTRITQARSEVERTETYLEALQSRINALTTDFVNRADPAQRSVIQADRNKALAELDRLKGDLQLQTKAVTDILEEARRATVPPGWLR